MYRLLIIKKSAAYTFDVEKPSQHGNQPEHSSASKPRSSRSVSATPLQMPQQRPISATEGTAEKDCKTL